MRSATFSRSRSARRPHSSWLEVILATAAHLSEGLLVGTHESLDRFSTQDSRRSFRRLSKIRGADRDVPVDVGQLLHHAAVAHTRRTCKAHQPEGAPVQRVRGVRDGNLALAVLVLEWGVVSVGFCPFQSCR
jgi:hypothetical protein